MNLHIFNLVISFTLIINVHSNEYPFFLNMNHFTGGAGNTNGTTKPCHNFYNFICNKWKAHNPKPKSEPFWNQYTLLDSKVHERTQKLIISSGHLRNERKFYEACLNNQHDVLYTNQLRQFIDKIGGWTMKSSETHRNYDFLQHIVIVTKMLNSYPILKLYVDVDFANTNKNILYIKPGSLAFPHTYLNNASNYTKQLDIYHQWILMTLHEIYPHVENMNALINDVINFEIRLAKLEYEFANDKYQYYAMDKLPVREWNLMLKLLYENTSVNIHLIKQIAIKPRYLAGLFAAINATESVTISNYIVWSAIKELSRDVSSRLRRINFAVDKAILGVRSDIAREYECTQKTLQYMPHLLEVAYVKQHIDADVFKHVRHLCESIRSRFLDRLHSIGYLSDSAKTVLIKKIKSLQFEIGLPSKRSQRSIYSRNLDDNHFLNVLRLKMFIQRNNLEELNDDNVGVKWLGHGLEVNAYYNTIQNAVILPMGLLSSPFYHPTLSPAVNYGALGSLIGHELSHALDAISHLKKHDRNAIIFNQQCFIKQYNSYGIDGVTTVGENIADLVGLQLSYDALFHAHDAKDQAKMFFMSYARMWCEHEGNNIDIDEEHSPVELRVLGALKNFQRFNEEFVCNAITNRTCRMW